MLDPSEGKSEKETAAAAGAILRLVGARVGRQTRARRLPKGNK
jgi:hypothetical protein